MLMLLEVGKVATVIEKFNGRELYWFNSGLIPWATAGMYQGGLIGAYYNPLGLIFTDNLLIARGGLGRECDQDPDTQAPSHSSG